MERVSLDDLDPAEAMDGVHLAMMAGGESMNIQHVAVEPGAVIDEHSHPHEQTGFLYEGELTFLVDGEEIVVGPGDSYAIPGDCPHAAENRGEETVRGIDIFSPPRENPSWQD
ncbi:cupin domain-containing protein [Natrialbaceae archaeon AArc-T1-2]|uniref:cupin domain-containing protein n=1 Tax=Natrialbaceae archaeon AArc-T1-2 TaxID=3053904 RepID=UPI00255ACD1F|nr:cupin domain-containing protein [Natrialbaceae archaeon AArc-T1-2]WIV66311.1 cupin domain-containing protein [Natrialbaceae archaeon AArc-T1-2]